MKMYESTNGRAYVVIREVPDDPRTHGVSRVCWLRIWWLGQPWPRRVRLQWRWPFVHIVKAQGCGCMSRPKGWCLKFRQWMTGASNGAHT